MRNAETRAALSACGVAADDIRFAGTQRAIADGRLIRHPDRALRAVREAWRAAGPHTALIIPAWEGGHPDHDAAHLIGVVAACGVGALDRVRQFPLYHGAGLPGPLFRVTTPLPDNGPCALLPVTRRARLRQLRRCLVYRSQWSVFAGLLPGLLRAALSARPFALQAVSLARTCQRPHAGTLLYERRGRFRYADFQARAEAFRTRHGVPRAIAE